MDKLKGLSKGGWHPPGDVSVSRKTWREDLKGVATGKKKDPNEEQRNHESRPLASLRDPSSFGAPPKHSGYYGANADSPNGSRALTASSSGSGGGGLGGPVPAPRPRLTQEELDAQEEAAKPPAGPYRKDTSGLRTDHLPAPPLRRNNTPGGSPGPPPPPRANPGLPARPLAAATPPPRAASARPPPVLPPRQNEYPYEHTPAPPPTYGEAVQPTAPNPALLNQSAINRLGQAGVSVPGFGIGGGNTNATSPKPSSTQGHPSQLNELQQRFSRLGTGSNTPPISQAQPAPTPSWQQQRQQPHNNAALSYAGQQTGILPPPAGAGAGAAAAAKKKPAPPPPPKKSNLQANDGAGPAPPPIPMSSKPKPT